MTSGWGIIGVALALSACASSVLQADVEQPKDSGGRAIQLAHVPQADEVSLHFDFGDLTVPMHPVGEGTYRADLSEAQLKGFPRQTHGFRNYRAQVIGKKGSEEVYSKPITINLR